jgi:DNA-binding transcriptional LysR family regulator
MSHDLMEGRLVHVLPDCEIPPESLSLVRPAGAFEPARLRLFIDFITAALRRSGSRSADQDP